MTDQRTYSPDAPSYWDRTVRVRVERAEPDCSRGAFPYLIIQERDEELLRLLSPALAAAGAPCSGGRELCIEKGGKSSMDE